VKEEGGTGYEQIFKVGRGMNDELVKTRNVGRRMRGGALDLVTHGEYGPRGDGFCWGGRVR